MIFYGARHKITKTISEKLSACKNCGNFTFNIFGKLSYVHIYWIPLFVVRKQLGTECLHCKKILLGTEIEDLQVEKFRDALFTKNILWYYSGSIGVGLIIFWFFFLAV